MEPIQVSISITPLLCIAALILGGILGRGLTRWMPLQQQSTDAQVHQEAETGLQQNEAKI
jgi:hypothetical protein